MTTSQDKSIPPTLLSPEEVGELGIEVQVFTIIVGEQIVLYFIILRREFCVFKQSKLNV